MSKTKEYTYAPIIHVLKLVALTVSILSAILCWMFSVSAVVVTGTIDQATETQGLGIQLAWDISSYLARLSYFSLLAGLLLGILYFITKKKRDNESKHKILGLVIFAAILIILTVFRENILKRLIVNNVG